MATLFRINSFAIVVVGLLGLSACGAEDEAVTVTTDTNVVDQGLVDEDHDDDAEDHDDDHEDHDDDAAGGLDAHEHGAAELSVGWNGGEMVIDLISPTYNIYGFEYEPETDEDKATAADRIDALAAPNLITVNPEAECSLSGEVLSDVVVEGSHSEITATWQLSCEKPDEIDELDTSALFAEFPNMEDIDAQAASSSIQSSAELTPASATFPLA